jgi:hypothetical protein
LKSEDPDDKNPGVRANCDVGVEWLNEVFSMFDDLLESYGLEKIRTIGDVCKASANGMARP